MAVLHNHIRSTHSIKVGNGLRAEVKGSAAAGALFPHSFFFIGVSPEIKNKKNVNKKNISGGIFRHGPPRVAVGKARVRWRWPGLSGRSQRLGLGPRCCALPAGGWTCLAFSLAQPGLFRAAFISKVTARMLSFGFSIQSVNFRNCESSPPSQTLFLLPSHFIVDLFFPQRL